MSRPGRKPLSNTERTVTVSIRMPESWYDRVYRRAAQERQSVPEALRDAVQRRFVTETSQQDT